MVVLINIDRYVDANITIDEMVVTGVGLRFKGFFGSLRICLGDWSEANDCRKLSYKALPFVDTY